MSEAHKAARAGHVEKVKELLEGGIRIDSTDGMEATFLYWSVASGNTQLVEELLQRTRPHMFQMREQTVFHLAASLGYKQIIGSPTKSTPHV